MDTARLFLGLPYSEKSTFVYFDRQDRPHGHLNCYGLFFVWAQRLELVDGEIWRSLQKAFSIAGVAPVLHAYMMRETAETPAADRGDWLLFRWRQASPEYLTEMGGWLQGNHHLAMLSETTPAPGGRVVHAVDTNAAAKGGTFETELGPHDAAQIHVVRTLPQFIN
ncbi:MAG: hypothetical protein EOP02_15145 [Proteobacteria bacterium]|nr:MAG: hypothetical protein EOP02_15145 [Pseudomonadota bacterium]